MRKALIKWKQFAIDRRPRVLTEEETIQINFLQKWKTKVQERRALQRSQSLEEIKVDETEKEIITGLVTDEDLDEFQGLMLAKAKKKTKYMTTESVSVLYHIICLLIHMLFFLQTLFPGSFCTWINNHQVETGFENIFPIYFVSEVWRIIELVPSSSPTRKI